MSWFLFFHLVLSALFLIIGAAGVVMNRNSIIISFMSIELMFLAAVLNFVTFSVYRADYNGQVFSLFILGVIAGEAVIGLALLLVYYRNKGNVSVSLMDALR